MSEHRVVLTTISSKEEAETLARDLVERRLVACVQLVEQTAVYRWEGEVVADPEILLVCKTRADRFGDLAAHVAEVHPYAVPELVELEVTAGSSAYLSWIDDAVRPADVGQTS